MGFRCGIVGAPNAGKSTLFNALTRSRAPAENYPFCTIESNVGAATVADSRLDAIADVVKTASRIPATLQFVDIAGLVKGASQGEGLGNRFLAHIREMDVIAHVAAAFDDNGALDDAALLNQIEIVNLELLLADLQTVSKAGERAAKLLQAGNKEHAKSHETLQRLASWLEAGEPVRAFAAERLDGEEIRDLFLLTDKPAFYVINVKEDQLERSFGDLSARLGAQAVTICAQLEAELAQLDEADRAAYRAELGMDTSALDRVIRAGYSLLGLKTFYTYNENETRAWTFPAGTTASQGAGMIHTDMEKGFIRAEVMDCDELIAQADEQSLRSSGHVRFEGRDYELAEGDIVLFKFRA